MRISKDLAYDFYEETLKKIGLGNVFPGVHIILRDNKLLWVKPDYLKKNDLILTEADDDRFWKLVYFGVKQNQNTLAKNMLYDKLNELYNLKNNSERDEIYKRVSQNMEDSLEYYRKATKLNWNNRVVFPKDFEKAKELEGDYDGIKFVLEEEVLVVNLKNLEMNRFLIAARDIDVKAWWSHIYNYYKPTLRKVDFFSFLTGDYLYTQKLELAHLDVLMILDKIFESFIEICQYSIYPSIHRASLANDELYNDYD
jgi:hypothetical protein